MSSDEEERSLFKNVFKNPVEVQKARLDRLMNNVEKPVFIPERKEIRPPRAFQPHEFVRNVMGASAGAGSGEFDIYRGCRRRQIIREAFLTREAKEKEANAQWLAKVENAKTKSEKSASKKRQKRLKQKGKPKAKKSANGQSEEKKSDSSSSSSDSDVEEETTTKTETEVPISTTETTSPVKEPTPTPTPIPAVQQVQEKPGIRQHLRHRKTSSSDEDEKKGASS